MLLQQNPIEGGCLFNSDLTFLPERLKAGVPHQTLPPKNNAYTNPLLVNNGAPAELNPKEETNMNREVFNMPCPYCSGDGCIGKKDGEVVRVCPHCDGTGEIPVNADEGLEIFESTIEGMKAVSNYQIRREYEGKAINY